MKQQTINLKLLKTLSILYVEDELVFHASLISTLEKIFKNVYVCKDGKEGINFYTANKDKVDVILSDYNMPKKNGMEMLEEIRLIDEDVPFIFLSAYLEHNVLLRCIELNVSHFAPKPADARNLLLNITKATELGHQKKIVQKREKEIEEYINIINQVAIISKTDLKGNITFVNDIFCEVSGYSKDELLGQPHNIVRHSEINKDFYASMWTSIKQGSIWKGTIKNKAKDESDYVVNATIMPIYADNDDENDAIVGYMAVRFLVTDEEKAKKDFRTQVRNLVTKNNEEKQELASKIEALEGQIFKLENSDYIEQRLKDEKDRAIMLNNQLSHYEKDILENERLSNEKIQKIHAKMISLSNIVRKSQEEAKLSRDEAMASRIEVIDRETIIKDLKKQAKKQYTRIKELEDRLAFMKMKARA